MNLHRLLDWEYSDDGFAALLDSGADVNERRDGETPLHVAARRRRPAACAALLERGADAEARDGGGKTAHVHALRRGFDDVVAAMAGRGAVALTDADRLAVALVGGRLEEGRAILQASPGAARTGNPEEDRLLADLAGRPGVERVKLLVEAGADLAATAMDGGTALHQAAWFGQPENARLLVDAGAPLDVYDACHHSSPLGWAVHGSRYSGGADEAQDAYVAIVEMLLRAGSGLRDQAYLERLRGDASERVAALLPRSV